MTKSFKDMTFLEQLHELKDTLQIAMAAENSRLSMDSWVDQEPTEPQHFCNTACCILGYQAVKDYDSDEEYNINILERFSGNLSDYLQASCNDVMECEYLANSVFYPYFEDRWAEAYYTELFTEEELSSIVHLNSDSPTFQDAIDYLDICIAKVNNYLQEK